MSLNFGITPGLRIRFLKSYISIIWDFVSLICHYFVYQGFPISQNPSFIGKVSYFS